MNRTWEVCASVSLPVYLLVIFWSQKGVGHLDWEESSGFISGLRYVAFLPVLYTQSDDDIIVYDLVSSVSL